ncbi:MAG: cytochrome c peroxidase [Pseudomonadales bacterium]
MLWICSTLSLAGFALELSGGAAEPYELDTACPPGFELVDDGCSLRTLYLLYDSLQGAGVGGLRTGLPPPRDGFRPQQIDLGRYLFFDPLLSADHTLSCASCHHPDYGFSDGRDRSIGITGEKVRRSAPSLWNVAFLRRLFWDGRSSTLEDQVRGPLFAADEMGNSEAELIRELNASPDYRRLFEIAFGEPEITPAQVYRALAAFESTLISLNSRYDHYAHGYPAALTDEEIEGLNIFRSFVARCSECHTPPLFTNQEIAVIGTPEPPGVPFDAGEGAFTGERSQRGGFRVPSLRNIALTAPYMHSGRFSDLREAVRFYTDGRGHAVPANEDLHLHWHIWEPRLSDSELDLLVSFLRTLSDQSFTPVVPLRVPSGLVPTGRRPDDPISTP